MGNRDKLKTGCLALIHTILAFALWYMLQHGVFQEPDGQVSILFLSISVVAALCVDAAVFILLFQNRNSASVSCSGFAVVFLLIHSLLLAGLWWLHAAGRLNTVGSHVDMFRLTLSIIAVLALDVVAFLLLFPSRKKETADSTVSVAHPQGQQKAAEKERNAPRIPTELQKETKQPEATKKKMIQSLPQEAEHTPPAEQAPRVQIAPYERLGDFEAELRREVVSATLPKSAQTQKQQTPVKQKRENPVPERETAERWPVRSGKPTEEKLGNDSMTALDEPVRGGKTVLDGGDGGGTVLDETNRSCRTVLDEPGCGGKTVIDGADGGGTLLDEANRSCRTVLDEPARGGKTILDEDVRGSKTVLDEQKNGVKTVLDSTAFPEKQRTPELQWNVRERKTAPQIEAEGSLTLPDITMLQNRAKEHSQKERMTQSSNISAALVYQDGETKFRIFLTEGETKLGSKMAKVDYVLPSRHISRLHAVFIKRGNRFFVRDAHSTNGTFLNGSKEPIPSDVDIEIHNGDIITLANLTFHFYVSEETEDTT